MKIICINDKKVNSGKLKLKTGEIYNTNNWDNPITSSDSSESLIYVFDNNNVNNWFVKSRFIEKDKLRIYKLERIINKGK